MSEEKMREEFEADAKPYGFDLTRYTILCTAGEPWNDYMSVETGHRWGGWQAAYASRQKEIDALEAENVRLNHQHKNDEAANMLLQEVCEMQRAKLMDARKQAIKEVEEMILELMELTSNKPPVEPVEVYNPHTKVVE